MPPKPECWLCMDLSMQSGSLSVHVPRADGLVCLAQEDLEDGGKHSESVLPGLERVLAAAGVGLADIDRFVTCTGPGSFTGLRIAFAALKAFALATGKPIELVDGHEARAWGYAREMGAARFVVSTAITRASFLVSEFEWSSGVLTAGKRETVAELPTSGIVLVERESSNGVFFPLHARHLGECLEVAGSRRSLSTSAEIAAAAPEYFGSRVY